MLSIIEVVSAEEQFLHLGCYGPYCIYLFIFKTTLLDYTEDREQGMCTQITYTFGWLPGVQYLKLEIHMDNTISNTKWKTHPKCHRKNASEFIGPPKLRNIPEVTVFFEDSRFSIF